MNHGIPMSMGALKVIRLTLSLAIQLMMAACSRWELHTTAPVKLYAHASLPEPDNPEIATLPAGLTLSVEDEEMMKDGIAYRVKYTEPSGASKVGYVIWGEEGVEIEKIAK